MTAPPKHYLHHFHGGLLLRHHKQMSCRNPLQSAALPAQFRVPLRQHKGNAAVPAVQVGEPVLRGQLIGIPEARSSAAVHAPTSGTVHSISRLPTPYDHHPGQLCITINSDGRDQACPPAPLRDWAQLPATQLVDHFHQHGIVGLGGAVFPSHRKLSTQRPLHTVIINGAECEPYLSCDEALMLHRPQAVVGGARILRHAAGAGSVIIAIEDRMTAVAEALTRQLAGHEREWLRIIAVPTYYPEGGERQLIQVLTGHEVPSGGLPQELGLVCYNAATAAACYDAVEIGQPLIERIVTVTGHCVKQPGNWRTRIGTPISQLLDAAGGFSTAPARLIMGGPLMGLALPHDALPVVKATNCLLALTATEVAGPQPEMPCVNCGFCVKVCPAQLLPQELHWAVRSGDLQQAQTLGLMDCIECGCCDQVCPSHIPLVEDYRTGKHQLRLQHDARQRAQHAKQRYQARTERLQQQAEETEQQRAKHKSALQSPADAKARITAALAKKKSAKLKPQRDDTK